jgi:putative transposase
MRLAEHHEDLMGRMKKCTNEYQKIGMKRAAAKMRAKSLNRVRDCHMKLAKWLCSNYDIILLPKFESSGMVSRDANGRRALSRQTCKQMLDWRHYRFRQYLLNHAQQYNGRVKVIIVNEAYTSKTCGRCGTHNNATRTYHCQACGYHASRDLNGAR